jgi:chromosome segregation ATPase
MQVEAMTDAKDGAAMELQAMTAECGQLNTLVDSLTAKKDDLVLQLATVNAERTASNVEVTSLTLENDALASQLEATTTKRDQLQATLDSVTRERDDVDSLFKTAKDQNATLEEQLSQAERQLEMVCKGMATSIEVRDDLTKELQMKESIWDQQAAAEAAVQEGLKEDLRQCVLQLEQTQAALHKCRAECQDLTSETKTIKAAWREQTSSAAQVEEGLEAQLRVLKQQVRVVQQILSDEACNELRSKLEHTEAATQSSVEQVDASLTQLGSALTLAEQEAAQALTAAHDLALKAVVMTAFGRLRGYVTDCLAQCGLSNSRSQASTDLCISTIQMVA